jgi:predicted nucleotidyltransferase
MKKSNSITKIKEDLDFCSNYWTVLYGSFVKGNFILNRSDVDVAIITKTKDKESNSKLWLTLLEKITPSYDIKIFELLPLFLKIEVIESYNVLFGDPLEISEYFYKYRSIWKEMVGRYKSNQFISTQEKISLLENQKRIK